MKGAARAARRTAATRPGTQRPPARAWRDRVRGDRPRDLLILAALATALYANSFSAGLILDSDVLIVQDPRVRAVRTENLSNILTQDYMAGRAVVSGVYRPVTTLSYLANYAVLGNGPRPAGYHAVNLLLHVANAMLVYLLAAMLLPSRLYALCTAAIFTAHPIATEAVTNVVGRADLLATLAVLGGTIAYMRSISAVGRAKVGWLIGLGVTTALGLLAKESAIAVVGVILAYDFTHRLGSSSAPAEAAARRRPLDYVGNGYVAILVALLAVGVVRWRVYADAIVQRPTFMDNPLVGTDFWSVRLTALKVLGRSIALLVWPRWLSWDYSYNAIPLVHWPLDGWEDWQAALALVGLIGALVVAVRSRRRQPALCFFLLFTVVTYLPTANLVMPIGTIMGERFLYMPSIGFAACVVLGLVAIGDRLRRPGAEVLTPAVVAVLVAVYGVRTIARNGDWRDEQRITQSSIEAAPRSAKVFLAHASALARRDGADPASLDAQIAHVEQALAIMDDPVLPIEMQESNVPLLLGIAYKSKGTYLASRGEDGRPWYERAAAMLERAKQIETAQNDEYRRTALARGFREDQIVELGGSELPYNLGDVRLLLGQPVEAAAEFARLRRRAPLSAQAHLGVARAATATGDLERAGRSLTIAVALGGRDAKTQGLLVDAYRRLDPTGCSVSTKDGRAMIDGSCKFVRTRLCAAYEELVEIGIEARDWRLARRVAEAAIATGDCEALPFERLLVRVAQEKR